MTSTAKLEALLDAWIEADPYRAEIFIETQLARLALRKRFARFNEGKK